jgi:hypothetical protein
MSYCTSRIVGQARTLLPLYPQSYKGHLVLKRHPPSVTTCTTCSAGSKYRVNMPDWVVAPKPYRHPSTTSYLYPFQRHTSYVRTPKRGHLLIRSVDLVQCMSRCFGPFFVCLILGYLLVVFFSIKSHNFLLIAFMNSGLYV